MHVYITLLYACPCPAIRTNTHFSHTTPTLVLTTPSQELRWLWNKRAAVPWGMPTPKFNLKQSLLLLDSDHDIPDDAEIIERGSEGSGTGSGKGSVFSDAVEEESKEILYNTYHGGLYGAGGPMYYKLFGDECITGEPRGPFPITRRETLSNGSVVTTTISAVPWSTVTTTTVTVTHPSGEGTGIDTTNTTTTTTTAATGAGTTTTKTNADAANPSTTNTDASMLDKEYVLRMPSRMTFNELHEKRKEGFLFDSEVNIYEICGLLCCCVLFA